MREPRTIAAVERGVRARLVVRLAAPRRREHLLVEALELAELGGGHRSAASCAASDSSAARTGNASSSSSVENVRTEQPRYGS